MRQLFAFLALGLLGWATASAQPPSCGTPGSDNAFMGIQTVRLWPGQPPDAHGNGCMDIPTMTIFDPAQGAANGSAVIIFPGGGYSHLAANLEGNEIANWFTARGFRAFVLAYRLASAGYLLPVPLLDARRAIQTVRARAADYHISPNRIVIIGFSAGGHLAALAGTQFVPGNPNAQDAVERVSSRPDYLVLGYPWIDAFSMDAPLNYCKIFNVADRCDELRAKYDPDLFVTRETPPTFIYHTYNDRTVPVGQSIGFFNALLKAGVPAEMHIFANGAHGSGLGKGDPALDLWPGLLEAWMRAHGLLTKEAMTAQSQP